MKCLNRLARLREPSPVLLYVKAQQWAQCHRVRTELPNEPAPKRLPEKITAKQRRVDWRFRLDNARVELKNIYPKIEVWIRTSLISNDIL